PRNLAIQGQTARAAEAYAKALADAPDQAAKARIVEESTQFDDVLTALHRRLADDQLIQEAYRRMVEKTAAEFSHQLDALTGQSSEVSASRAKLIAAIIRRQDGVFERLLKLRPEDTLLQAVNDVLMGDWKNAAAHYSKLTELNAMANSIAWMTPS